MSGISVIVLPVFCILATGVAFAVVVAIKRSGSCDPTPSGPPAREMANGPVSRLPQSRLLVLLSPVVLAVMTYLISFILILFMPLSTETRMVFPFAVIILFSGYSAISPIINLFLPRWWLNTLLFVVSWSLLFYGLLATTIWKLGQSADDSGLGIAFGLPMTAAGLIFPFTVLVKLIMAVRKTGRINR